MMHPITLSHSSSRKSLNRNNAARKNGRTVLIK